MGVFELTTRIGTHFPSSLRMDIVDDKHLRTCLASRSNNENDVTPHLFLSFWHFWSFWSFCAFSNFDSVTILTMFADTSTPKHVRM